MKQVFSGIRIRKSHLKVFSAVCANFVVVWFVAAFATSDMFVLTRNVSLAIMALYAAILAEEELEK